jgi:hypothetical protein
MLFIEQYLNEESLAWWYQDDGHLSIVNGKVKKIVLSTDSFTVEENGMLIDLLQLKYKLNFKLDGKNRLLLCDQAQIYYFLKLVEPYLISCMSRKMLPITPEFPSLQEAKRTTLYLPEHVKIYFRLAIYPLHWDNHHLS